MIPQEADQTHIEYGFPVPLPSRRSNFLFRKRSLPFVTVDAISNKSFLVFMKKTESWSRKYN